jgi:serine/threonine protein kinase
MADQGQVSNNSKETLPLIGAHLRMISTEPGASRIQWTSPVSPLPLGMNPSMTELQERRKLGTPAVVAPPITVDGGDNPEWVVHSAPSGQSLRTIQRSNGPLSVDVARTLLARVIDVVIELHHLGLPHGNINPDTVFVNESGVELIPSYECIDRQLATPGSRPRSIWTSEEMERSEPPRESEDVRALALLFVQLIGMIDDALIKNRTEVSQHARELIGRSVFEEPLKVSLSRALSPRVDERPTLSIFRSSISEDQAQDSTWPVTEQKPNPLKTMRAVLRRISSPETPHLQRRLRWVRRIAAASILVIALVTGITTVRNEQATSKALRGDVAVLESDLRSAEADAEEMGSNLRTAESTISDLESDLQTAQSEIELLSAPQSTYYDYDGYWTVELSGPGVCSGWTSNTSACSWFPESMSISYGSVTFGNYSVPPISSGGATPGGFNASGRNSDYYTCDYSETTAVVTLNLVAESLTPTTDGISVDYASGTLTVEISPQFGCTRSSKAFSIVAYR